jgi:ADP-ribosyl-[dinitrogen reductase] hydrolase
MERIDRYRGCLLGLAVGDALGTTLEFSPPGTFEPIQDMVGGGPFGLDPGQWTDDTSMALCLAESLIERNGFDAEDQMKRYVRWYREGHLSSTGVCFDIGNTIRGALHEFEVTGNPYAGSTHPRSAGNGSIMRPASVPLFFAHEPTLAIEKSGDSSRTTHALQVAINLGDDADTTGAVYGQIAGAFYGEGGIPVPWLNKLAKIELIRDYADRLKAAQAK